MKPCFADSSFFIALLVEDDEAHDKVLAVRELVGNQPIITTAWILTELADALSAPNARSAVISFIQFLRADKRVTVLPAEQSLFDRGLALYSARADKFWSLTDCISFVVMQEHGITDALTTDHHYEQAGFKMLL